MMKVRLVAVGSQVRATAVDVPLPAVVGRGKQATVSLPHPAVSRRHCELFDCDGKLMVRDLGSLNGTFVGNQRVEQSEVPLGELLTVATLSFRVVSGEPSTGQPGDAPRLLRGADDAFGAGASPPRAGRPPRRAAAEICDATPRATRGRQSIVEGDTECPRGSVPDRDGDDGGEDLSRLLNGR